MNALPDSQMQAIIRLENIERSYWMGAETIHALHGVSLTIERWAAASDWARPASTRSTPYAANRRQPIQNEKYT